MNDYIFSNEYINNIKKDIINYVSRITSNVNKVTFNLSLYTNFVISDRVDTNIQVTLPTISRIQMIPAKIVIGKEYFNIKDDTYYIKEEYEEKLLLKITEILVEGASMKVKYENMKPVSIESIGMDSKEGNGFHKYLTSIIASDISGITGINFDDITLFNKSIIRMILALAGYRNAFNTYFNHDNSLYLSLITLSTDNELYNRINKKITLISGLIETKYSKYAIKDRVEEDILDKIIRAKELDLLYLIINELYIPYINSVPLDRRKYVRDEILRGFLGSNYTELKLNDSNKESYYFASLINNSISINNKVADQTWNFFKKQVEDENSSNMGDIYAKYSLNKTRNGIREFWVIIDKTHVYIDTGKKSITEKKLVTEMLSYAYIMGLDDETKDKIETNICRLCLNHETFSSKLGNNPLSNMMYTAAIIQLASKNGHIIELKGIKNNIANFEVK